MIIRRYIEADHSQLVALWKKVFPDDPPHNDPASVIDAKRKVDDFIFVATEADQIIAAAMAGYDGHRGWLYAVAVDPPKRRNGIGSALVRHMVCALHDKGCIKINLQLRSANAATVSFYESLGFKVEDRISMGL